MKSFRFLFIHFFLIVKEKGKELKKTDRVMALRGCFVCLFVCLCFFEGNDVDMRRKEIRVDRVYTY